MVENELIVNLKGWEMTIYLGKWQYKVTRKGLEPQKFNIYADSWVNIID